MAEQQQEQAERREPEARRPEREGAPEPKAGPDWERAAGEYRAQRDQARQQVADLTAPRLGRALLGGLFSSDSAIRYEL